MLEHRCRDTEAETVLEIMLKHGVAVAEIKLLLYMLKHSAGTVAETQFVTYAETQICHIC